MIDFHHALYAQVKERLRNKIQEGTWTQGQMIPNELELADLFQVSQGTIRRALKELVNEGVLIRIQGKGTYVASFTQNVNTLRERINWFYPDDPELGAAVMNLVDFEVIDHIPPKIARLIECSENEKLFHIRRELSYRKLNSICGFDDIFLRVSDFPGLTKEFFTDPQFQNPYMIYQEKFGHFITDMEDKAKAVFLNPEQAAKAQVPCPYPAICLQRRSFTISGHLLELRFIVNVTDYQYLRLRSAEHH